MSTYMPKNGEVERKWYIIDASGKPLGRVAVEAANLLRGKNKPIFAPHVDCGDHVIIINCAKAVLTGNKLTQKYYYRHAAGYVGNLKSIKCGDLMKTHPEKAMHMAVEGMLQDNALGRKQIVRLRTFADSQHNHEAQKPEIWKDAEGNK